MVGRLMSGLFILAPTGGALFAYYRLRTAAAERRLADARVFVGGDPIR